jgi:hypothetical protein
LGPSYFPCNRKSVCFFFFPLSGFLQFPHGTKAPETTPPLEPATEVIRLLPLSPFPSRLPLLLRPAAIDALSGFWCSFLRGWSHLTPGPPRSSSSPRHPPLRLPVSVAPSVSPPPARRRFLLLLSVNSTRDPSKSPSRASAGPTDRSRARHGQADRSSLAAGSVLALAATKQKGSHLKSAPWLRSYLRWGFKVSASPPAGSSFPLPPLFFLFSLLPTMLG